MRMLCKREICYTIASLLNIMNAVKSTDFIAKRKEMLSKHILK